MEPNVLSLTSVETFPLISWWLFGFAGCIVSFGLFFQAQKRVHERICNNALPVTVFSETLAERMFGIWMVVTWVMLVAALLDFGRFDAFPLWQLSLAFMVCAHGMLLGLWFFGVVQRTHVAHIFVVVTLSFYLVRAYGSGHPFFFVLELSPIPFWCLVFSFWTNSIFGAISFVATLILTLVLEYVVPRIANPWISIETLQGYYGKPVPLILAVFSVLFAFHVKHDQYLRDEKLFYHSGLKDQIYSELSHELRTPLNGIMGSLQLIQNSHDVPHSKFLDEQLSCLNFCASAISILTTNVLAKEARQKEPAQSIDVRLFLAGVMSTLNALKVYKPNLNLKLDVSMQVPDRIMIAPSALSQVLLNLGSNAIKFQEKGEIVVNVSVKENGRCLVFEFRDEGRGMSRDFVQNRLFKAYFREQHVGKSIEGSGLGLFISKQLVDSMGGKIVVEPNISRGEGTVFCVVLPMETPSPTPVAMEESGDQENLVIIVDDTNVNLKILQSMVVQCGLGNNIMSFDNGFESVSHVMMWAMERHARANRLQKPKVLIFLDKEMPGLTGTDVLQIVRTVEKVIHIPIFVVGVTAGYWNDSSVDRIIKKPVQMIDVKEAICDFERKKCE
jgi:signal transduction histidine kinase/CheY-like chemotaxis protein